MRIPTIGSRVKFICAGTLWQGMVFDRRPDEQLPLFVVSLGCPNVFRMRDEAAVIVSGQFCAPATSPAE